MHVLRLLLHSSPAVSEVALGLGGRAVFAVVGKIVPDGTTSVVSVGTCARSTEVLKVMWHTTDNIPLVCTTHVLSGNCIFYKYPHLHPQ